MTTTHDQLLEEALKKIDSKTAMDLTDETLLSLEESVLLEDAVEDFSEFGTPQDKEIESLQVNNQDNIPGVDDKTLDTLYNPDHTTQVMNNEPFAPKTKVLGESSIIDFLLNESSFDSTFFDRTYGELSASSITTKVDHTLTDEEEAAEIIADMIDEDEDDFGEE